MRPFHNPPSGAGLNRLLSPEERKLLNELLGTNSDDGVGGKLLHIDLTDIDGDVIKIKYFWSDPNKAFTEERSLSQLTELKLKQGKNSENLGKSLYNWLNLPDKVINLINQQQEIILAIALPEQLSGYDWESLHLVNKKIVPILWFKQSREPVSRKNRPLSVLFMAAEPIGSQSQINFEQQEIKILEGTKRYPIKLVIEESGSLEGLKETRKYFFPDKQDNLNNLDILHLAADVDGKDRKDCLLTESEYGDRCESNAQEIMGCFKETFPQLIFLSSNLEMTSLPSDLIQQQANLVLTVNYQESEEVISVVYDNLASGETLETTILKIYRKKTQEIYRNKPNLSSLRLYLADTRKLSETLVTEEGYKTIPFPVEAAEKFIDNAGKMKVADRGNFVGRRRQLQNCLRSLKSKSRLDQKVGVLIHGMGGLGKSSIASRMISDRLRNYEPIIWSRWTEDNKNEKKEPLNEKSY